MALEAAVAAVMVDHHLTRWFTILPTDHPNHLQSQTSKPMTSSKMSPYLTSGTRTLSHGVNEIFDPNFHLDMNNYDNIMLFKAKQTFFYAVLCYTIKPMELHQYVERHCAQSNAQAALQEIVDHMKTSTHAMIPTMDMMVEITTT
jgi:hypothetical protein